MCNYSIKQRPYLTGFGHLGVFQIFGWPILHAEEDALEKIEAEDGEALEEKPLPLLRETQRADEP